MQPVRIETVYGPVRCSRITAVRVYRVGYKPEPWQWTPWEFADEYGRFTGRWDDPAGVWRTIYVGLSALACYLEVLAAFRADPVVADELNEISVDEADEVQHPTVRPGEVPRAWCEPRLICSAELSGCFARLGHHETLPTLRQQFLYLARQFGLDDLDGAAIRDGMHRGLTQAISAWVYRLARPDGTPITGIEFVSRHGDELTLWAIYERLASVPSPPEITNPGAPRAISEHDPDLSEAMRIHHLTWTI
jgi:hypothetical protein